MTGKQVYNDENMTRLKLWLSTASDQEHKKYYEVLVDGMKIVFKTDDLSKLEDLSMWVNRTAKIIKVLVYSSPGSHRYQTFEFHTEYYLEQQEEERQKKDQVLFGFANNVDEKIVQAIENERKEQATENLKKENKSLKQELEGANTYIGQLETKVDEYEAKKFKLDKDTIIKIGSGILGHIVKTNPKIIDKVAELSGLMSDEGDNEQPTQQGEVTFSKKIDPKEVDDKETENDEETLSKLALFETAEENLSDEEYDKYFQIVQFLANHPPLVTVVHGLLKDESKRLKQAA
jgi:hypothetical protein